MATIGDNAYLNLFQGARVEDLVGAQQKVKSLKITDSVDFALEFLAENEILAAPVLDRQKSKFVGIVDVKDILDFIVGEIDSKRVRSNSEIQLMEFSGTIEQVLGKEFSVL